MLSTVKLQSTCMTWKLSRRCSFSEFYIYESVSVPCSTHDSVEDMKMNLKLTRGFSRIQQALEYSRVAKDVLELVKVSLAHPKGNTIL